MIGAREEAETLIPAIEALVKEFPGIVISADTFYGEVARKAAGAGAAMINDVSAWEIDSDMLEAVISLGLPYILMHMKGTPSTMQEDPRYTDVMGEITHFFSEKINTLRLAGVCDIILDPGFGFGKNPDQNIELFRKSNSLSMFGLPLLAGISRKKTIQHIAGTDAAHALNATTAAHVLALQKGFRILRVHDVKEAREAIKVWSVLSDDRA
jgi:dihydropteroate synthase